MSIVGRHSSHDGGNIQGAVFHISLLIYVAIHAAIVPAPPNHPTPLPPNPPNSPFTTTKPELQTHRMRLSYNATPRGKKTIRATPHKKPTPLTPQNKRETPTKKTITAPHSPP
jgi:hypothetical protein